MTPSVGFFMIGSVADKETQLIRARKRSRQLPSDMQGLGFAYSARRQIGRLALCNILILQWLARQPYTAAASLLRPAIILSKAGRAWQRASQLFTNEYFSNR